MLVAVMAFLRSPLGKYLMIGLAVLALIAFIEFHGRSAQAKHDKPLIFNATTGKTWQSEAQRDAASLATCRTNTSTLEGALASQNASVAALKADGERRAKMLSEGLQQARKAAHEADSRALAILAVKPRGADACARLLALDRAINGGQP